MYDVRDGCPSAQEYRRLRASVGWSQPPMPACRTALASTIAAVIGNYRTETVAMARLVGDATLYLLLVDVVVAPEHQGTGLGRRMVRRLHDWASQNGTRNTLLVAGDDLVPFYRNLGFHTEPNTRMMRG